MIAPKKADQYLLRFPDGMRKRIAERANANGRSINTEIIDALERALKNGDRMDELERRVAKLEHTFNL